MHFTTMYMFRAALCSATVWFLLTLPTLFYSTCSLLQYQLIYATCSLLHYQALYSMSSPLHFHSLYYRSSIYTSSSSSTAVLCLSECPLNPVITKITVVKYTDDYRSTTTTSNYSTTTRSSWCTTLGRRFTWAFQYHTYLHPSPPSTRLCLPRCLRLLPDALHPVFL